MPEAGTTPQRPKIHFLALIGVALDADLFPWWIPHYKALNLDSYTVFLHEGPDASQNLAAQALFIREGFRVTMLPEKTVRDNPVCPGDPGIGVRSVLFDLCALALLAEDFIVTADGDEFQVWTESPHAALARGLKLVTGSLIDCFDDTLHGPDPEKTLAENYPIEYYNLSGLWRSVPYKTQKICMSPSPYPVDFSGSHEVKRDHTEVTPRLPSTGPLAVLHYRWRESAFKRVQNRPNWPPEEIAFIKNFFHVGAEDKA